VCFISGLAELTEEALLEAGVCGASLLWLLPVLIGSSTWIDVSGLLFGLGAAALFAAEGVAAVLAELWAAGLAPGCGFGLVSGFACAGVPEVAAGRGDGPAGVAGFCGAAGFAAAGFWSEALPTCVFTPSGFLPTRVPPGDNLVGVPPALL